MNTADIAILRLEAMIDDTANHQLFHRDGPLSWFSLEKTFVAATKKGALSDNQCTLIEKVYREYGDLKRAAQDFGDAEECRRLTRVLEDLQRAKPPALGSDARSRSQRLAKIVHALCGHRAIHVGDFDDAERLVAEVTNENLMDTWEVIHSARRRYLWALYGQNTVAVPSTVEQRSNPPMQRPRRELP
jgi:hypothetical protein